jgi:uncharacterized phage protein (TIGR01671 family)
MREILFKGKSGQTWYYGGVFKYNTQWFIATEDGNTFRVSPTTICQYTGLKDFEGMMIFEGDIVKTSEVVPAYGTDTFTIDFAEGNFYICNTGTIATLRSWAETVKVVGNIYDNN